jgi:ADP-heptose:LPS heptosyltransferase
MPRLDRLIAVEKRRYSLHWLEIWGQLATTRWDLVVDLRASAIAWLLWTRDRRVIQGGRRPGHRLTHLAALLGVTPPPLPVIWTAPEDTARAAALLPEGRPWLVLGPTANWHRKVWPAERFAELALRLTGWRPPRRWDCHSGRAGGSGTQHGDPRSDRLAPGA